VWTTTTAMEISTNVDNYCYRWTTADGQGEHPPERTLVSRPDRRLQRQQLS